MVSTDYAQINSVLVKAPHYYLLLFLFTYLKLLLLASYYINILCSVQMHISDKSVIGASRLDDDDSSKSE